MDILRRELDSEQAAVAADLSGNLLLLAGPGSGKTRVITQRIAFLHRIGRIPRTSRALAITFTNKAAAEMRDRLRIISSRSSEFSTILTFHKLGERILRSYGYLIGIQPDFAICDDTVQTAVLREVANELGLGKLDAARTAAAIDRLKSEYGSADRARPVLLERKTQRLPEIISRYETMLHEQNMVDFSDLIWMPTKILLTFPVLKRVLQDLYPHVLIDECQDTNQVQFTFVREAFSGSRSLVFAVADEDQSIYTWRGARIQNLRDFLRDFDARVIQLKRNYRCHPSIVRVADALIFKSSLRLKSEPSVWSRPDDGKKYVNKVTVPNTAEEGSFIARTATKLMTSGTITRWSDISVLARNWYYLRSAAEALDAAEIPRVVLNETEIRHTPEVESLFAALRLSLNPDDPINAKLLLELLTDAGHPRPEMVSLDGLDLTSMTPMRLYNELRSRLDISGMIAAVPEAERKNRIEAVQVFQRYCARAASFATDPSSFVRLLTLEGRVEQSISETSTDAISLMSMHTAKGTERKVVFVLALDDEIFPRFDIEEDSPEWEEERRLLYMSITRAQDCLFLVHCESRPTKNGFERARDPSRLLSDIDPDLSEYV